MRVTLSHGNGGRFTRELVEEIFQRHYGNAILRENLDAGLFPSPGSRLAMTVDGYTVNPLFFPGGNIGTLAVNGTVNDLAVSGARPVFLTVSFIIEEGFAVSDLERVAVSLAKAASDAGVTIVAGDTKVVEQGKGDGLYISTSGIGAIPEGREFSPRLVRPGDVLLASGTMGDHGATIMLARQGFGLEASIESDCAPVNGLVETILAAANGVRFMRDPTRGGLAQVAADLAREAGVRVVLDESKIPVREAVRGVCDILGFDPYYLANEGKVIVACAPEDAARVFSAMRGHPLGRDAAVIGTVAEGRDLILRTPVGGYRILDELEDDPLPRIC